MTEEGCCPLMKEALDWSAAEAKMPRPKQVPGFTIAHVFARGTGQFKGSPLVYTLPARGRGPNRTPTKNLVVNSCPFCGKAFH